MARAPKGDRNLLREFARYVWPAEVSLTADLAAATQAVLSVLAIVLALGNVFGWVSLSTERAEQVIVGAAGIFLLGFLIEAGERRKLLAAYNELSETVSIAAGRSSVRQVEPDAIGPGLDLLVRSSTDWVFRGGSARYLRAKSLPTLGDGERDADVLIGILDPRDGHLCNQYGIYRRMQGRGRATGDDQAEMRQIQADILATIYAANWYTLRKRVQARVVLFRSFSPLRYDIGTSGLYVTVADLTQPGLYAEAGTWYYDNLRDEIEQAPHGHPSILPPSDPVFFPDPIEHVTAEDVRGALDATKVKDPSGALTPLLTDAANAAFLNFQQIRDAVKPVGYA